jgi:D-alanine-D-alanine ligase
MKAMDFTKYVVLPFYITKNGEWRSGLPLLAPAGSKEQLAFGESSPARDSAGAYALQPIFGGLRQGDKALVAGAEGTAAAEAVPDVVFPLLHGTYGEDGTVQGLLEIANIPYVGAGVLASAVGMDKVMMKKVFAQAGLPQVVYRHFTKGQWEREQDEHIMEIEVAVGYPCFVKPANLGSSVGISKARNRDELLKAVAEAFQFDRKVIVEEGVDAREVEVAVLGNDEPQASVVGEIVASGEFYDYKAKYIDGKSVMVIPAELPPELSGEIRAMALRAFEAIDGSGLSRVDFFLRRADNAILINEINTMPGFTPFSMYPLLWRESGKPYGELVDDLIRLAIERHAEKQKIRYTFDVE